MRTIETQDLIGSDGTHCFDAKNDESCSFLHMHVSMNGFDPYGEMEVVCWCRKFAAWVKAKNNKPMRLAVCKQHDVTKRDKNAKP